MKDIDARNEDLTYGELLALVNLLENPGYKLTGFHYTSLSRDLLSIYSTYLEKHPGLVLPMQVATGPLVNLTDIMVPDVQMVSLIKKGQLKLIYHLPFPFTLYGEVKDSLVVACKNYLNRHFNAVISVTGESKLTYVLHSSYPNADRVSSDQNAKFVKNLEYVFSDTKGDILIENLVGSNKHPRPWGSPEMIFSEIVIPARETSLGDRVGLCFDTEHYFGSGHDWEDILSNPMLVSSIRVVHLNSHPSNVIKGSRHDLHSYTSLRSTYSKENLTRLLSVFRGAWVVTERRLPSVSISDWLYCQSCVLDLAATKEDLNGTNHS